MAFNPSSPVTGGAQSGFTSPTYTLVSESAPETNAKSFSVSALGGTQTGVTTHSASSPFTLTAWRPKVLAFAASVGTDGVLRRNPTNEYKIITRHGAVPVVGQSARPVLIRTIIEIPAGADVADPANVKAAISLHLGALFAESSGIGLTALTGSI